MMMQKYIAFVSNHGTIGARGQDFLLKKMELIYMFAPSVSSFATTQAARRFLQEEVIGEFF